MPNRGNAVKGLSYLVGTGLVAIFILLTGCATTYRPENLTGGYSDLHLQDTTYRVRFKGNNYTSRAKVEQLLLYRCAELTTQLGYAHFYMLSQDTLDISDPLARIGIFPRNYYATALIQVVHQSDNQVGAYNAQEVMRKVQAQYPKDLGS
jgi:hypothetical protein